MRQTRQNLIIITLILVAIGVVMVYSSSGIYAEKMFGDSAYFLKRQLAFAGIGLAGLVLSMLLSLEKLKKYARAGFILALLLLVLVIATPLGREVGGAKRWLRAGIFSFQPVEFAKVMLVVYLADLISKKGKRLKEFLYGFLPCMLVLGIVLLLLLLQPDLGMAILIAVVAGLMFLISGIKLRYLTGVILGGLPLIYYMIFRVDYRRKRILAFLNPWADERGAGFQIIQSWIALASGGLFGLGLGQSRQKLFYLPESHTDFIFSIIGEELGLLGTASILILFILLVWQGAKVAFNSPDAFSHLLCFGLVSMLGLEAIINIGVATGALPTKGLPLPFVSYGGSSLVFHLIAIGLLLNVSKRNERILSE